MPLGVDRPRREINVGDSAELSSYVMTGDDLPIDPATISSVHFKIERPDDVIDEADGTVQGNGAGYYLYYNTSTLGRYTVTATHNFVDGRIRTDRFYFDVIDPLNPPPLSKTESLAEKVWMRFEDLFDSEYGGPWLRDMTLSYFNKDKIPEFIGEAMLEINTFPPPTTLTILDFTTPVPSAENPGETIPDPDESILTMALTIVIIRHLIRSYVEQPQPQGAQVVWHDRRDYQQRWEEVLQLEEARFQRILAVWKRQFYSFYGQKLLIGSKAGRLYGPGMRQRNSMRGYW